MRQGEAGVSLGIGLTNDCDLDCPHCYRPRGDAAYLGLDEVVKCLDTFDVASVNLGTGENYLNEALPAVLDELHRRDLKTSLTSNGLTLLRLDEERLGRLHDVEVSFDFATRAGFDAFRGEGTWLRAIGAVERCVGLGVPVTVLAVMMRINHDCLVDIARLASDLGASFRVNVFQPVYAKHLAPTWGQFWDGFARLFAATTLITCTEPVVVAALNLDCGPRTGGRCGTRSLRLTPTGAILPCVYWPREAARLSEIACARDAFESAEFEQAAVIPEGCRECSQVERCGGGCASRRALTVGVAHPDPYCPAREGEPIRLLASLGPEKGGRVDLLHAANVCTTIVRA